MNKRYAVLTAQIGRLIVIAIPEVDFVTVIFPFPCNGTTQLSGTFDYVIDAIEKRKES
jgi:hypothetical protein